MQTLKPNLGECWCQVEKHELPKKMDDLVRGPNLSFFLYTNFLNTTKCQAFRKMLGFLHPVNSY